MDTPSKRVFDYLDGHADIDFPVCHFGDHRRDMPYAIVRQSGGDFEVAAVDVEVFAKDGEVATASAEKVRKAMKFANLKGAVPSLQGWQEGYVVPPDGIARAAVFVRYNLPVYQER